MTNRKPKAIYVQVHFDDGSSIHLQQQQPHDLRLDVYAERFDMESEGVVKWDERVASNLPTKVFGLTSVHEGMYIITDSVRGILNGVEPHYSESHTGEEYVSGVRLTIDDVQLYYPQDKEITLVRNNNDT